MLFFWKGWLMHAGILFIMLAKKSELLSERDRSFFSFTVLLEQSYGAD